MLDHFIECPRFGGRRPATGCVHFDRYKSCRRTCTSLKKHLEAHPNLVEAAKEAYAEKVKAPEVKQLSLFPLPSKHSGKYVPDPALACLFCKFVAKTPRGLRVHLTRTHKKAKKSAA